MADYDIQNLKFPIVDDDTNMCHLISTILGSLGVKEVRTASSVDKGFKILFELEADIVICDLRMEPKDGLEFTRMVRTRENSPNCYVPIIMLTGHTAKKIVESARDAGVHEFLAKPVSATKLYGKIRSIIDHNRVFICSGDYIGPDQRRRDDANYDGPERRKSGQS